MPYANYDRLTQSYAVASPTSAKRYFLSVLLFFIRTLRFSYVTSN